MSLSQLCSQPAALGPLTPSDYHPPEIALIQSIIPPISINGQACGLRSAVEALQVRLDTLPPEEWGAVQEEVAAAKQLTEALQREVPPPAAAAAAAGGSALPPAVVDDSSTTGAPAAALQLVAVAPAADAAADAPRALQLN